MGKYSSDNPATIEGQFSLEGDALKRAAFTEPDLSSVPDERPLSGEQAARAFTQLTGIVPHPAYAELIDRRLRDHGTPREL